MSRYSFRGKDPRHRITVGWDNPLATYFAQVWDERSIEADEPEFWVGCELDEVETVERLAELLAAYGEVPPEVLSKLGEDFRNRTAPSRILLLLRR